ncbi:secreted protein [Colletotrichum plurivorum]|uniref:Secreted protein n=1 Tax=Colletotrichum plurivorum TaxID=2175906 RepID=A0A8H6NDB9_9PEZI|nr:secreted protein [Colletotrichum plurivorum]
MKTSTSFRDAALLAAAAVSTASAASIARRADVSACKLPANSSAFFSSGFGVDVDCAPSTGTVNALMLFIDFPDQTATESSPRELYDYFFPDATKWFDASSYGKLSLNITADTTRFLRMPKPAPEYQFEGGLTAELHQIYVKDALEKWLRVTNTPVPGVNSTEGPLTDILYVIPTRNATAITFSATLTTSVYTYDVNYIARKAVTQGFDTYDWWGYKALNHETGHAFCLPDLYPLPTGDTGMYTGNWDMMAKVNARSPDYFAWNKWRLGWLADDQVDCVAPVNTGAGNTSTSTTHKLTPLETAGGVKAVVVRHSERAALVAEVRAKGGADEFACTTGVLLYTVSTDKATGEGPIRVLGANPGGWGSAACASDELDNAPLTLGGEGVSSYTVEGWGVTVTVVEQVGDDYTIRVDVK